jgi:hypothetical protein
MSLGQLKRMKRGLSIPARAIIEHLLSVSDHMACQAILKCNPSDHRRDI